MNIYIYFRIELEKYLQTGCVLCVYSINTLMHLHSLGFLSSSIITDLQLMLHNDVQEAASAVSLLSEQLSSLFDEVCRVQNVCVEKKRDFVCVSNKI